MDVVFILYFINELTVAGYYEHIEKPEDIREKVLNYLLVMARPLVMYENNHPIHWSSVYLDGKVRRKILYDPLFIISFF